MKNSSDRAIICINDINLWAHVGLLDRERLLGQYFNLDIELWVDVSETITHDDLSSTVDYSLAVQEVQKLALDTNCSTIEAFSEKILDRLDYLYGPIPKHISLFKCNPPIDGFIGNVSIKRSRHLTDLNISANSN